MVLLYEERGVTKAATRLHLTQSAGVAYASMSQTPLAGYWELVALIAGGVCIFTEWGKSKDRQARVRLIWTQAVHWVAVLVGRREPCVVRRSVRTRCVQKSINYLS